MGEVCCFIGHRRVEDTAEWRRYLDKTIERMIVEEGVDTFLFGSKSRFNSLCYEAVTRIKEKYPHIKRVYVRAEFPYINEEYCAYLSQRYEKTYFPERLLGAGRGVYVERNREMIDNSRFCVFYYRENGVPQHRHSGTEIALSYAVKRKKQIYCL